MISVKIRSRSIGMYYVADNGHSLFLRRFTNTDANKLFNILLKAGLEAGLYKDALLPELASIASVKVKDEFAIQALVSSASKKIKECKLATSGSEWFGQTGNL